MTDEAPAQSPFVPGTHVQWAWDSTSLGYLKECDYKYWLSIIEGWRAKTEALNFRFGRIYHSALEHYDKHRFAGLTHDAAEELVLQEALEASYPWPFDDPNKSRENLIRSIIWYLEHQLTDGSKTVTLANGLPAVELSFRFQIDAATSDGTPYFLAGHLDRIAELQGDLYISDHKTTKTTLSSYYFEQYNPDNQMSLYSLAGQVVYNLPIKGVIINGAQVAVGFTRFERGITHRTSGQLQEWLGDTVFWLQRAETNALRGVWPRNDKSCTKYGGCVFLDICRKDPSVRQAFLETKFNKETPWNPLRVR